MTSACAAFSQCRIQFTVNGQQHSERNYSERSLIELRQHDFAIYSLRALDIENKNKEIFNIPLENERQYRPGRTNTHPDEIDDANGTFRLWLNASSRTKFHDALNLAIQEIKLLGPESNPISTTPPVRQSSTEIRRNYNDDDDSRTSHRKRDTNPPKSTIRRDDDDDDVPSPKPNSRRENNPPRPSLRRDDDDDHPPPRTNLRGENNPPKSTIRRDDDDDVPPPKPNPQRDDNSQKSIVQRDDDDPPRTNPRYNEKCLRQTSQSYEKDILVDVYQLGQHIRQGHIDEAVDVAKRLAEHQVCLQVNSSKDNNEERPIPIQVKIDSNDTKITRKYDNNLLMNVYPSTTIRELRTSFDYLENIPPSNQYLFVHGHLAHDNSNMQELNILPNSLFVLFIIQQ